MSEEPQVIDVVNTARELLESKGVVWARTAVPGGPLPEIAPQPGSTPLGRPEFETCQFGHPNPVGGHFCPECGLKVGVVVLDMEAILTPPKPESELTPEEKAQRDLDHQQALSVNAMFDRQDADDFQPTAGPEKLTIHFVDDGFTALGHVWLRGQQISIGPDHPRWADVTRWISLTPEQQIGAYGKQYFAPGPFPREETQMEQFRQVEMRRAYGRMATSAVPDAELLGARD